MAAVQAINVIAGSDDDYISLVSSSTENIISVGSGKNTVIAQGTGQSVYAGNDDNLITVGSGYVNVGDGQNNISLVTGGYASVFAGSGNDTINIGDNLSETAEKQYRNHISITGGDNYLSNAAELSTISTGEGNDTIITGDGYGSADVFGAYADTYNSIVVGAGDDKISVKSYMSAGTISAGDGGDVVLIESASESLINLGTGRNTIISDNAVNNTKNTITAGSGSDSINISGNENFISAGSGKNYIYLAGGSNNTIVTGGGRDTINLDETAFNNVIVFGGGNDIVMNYRGGDSIAAVGTLTRNTFGNDVILSDGTNQLILKDAVIMYRRGYRNC